MDQSTPLTEEMAGTTQDIALGLFDQALSFMLGLLRPWNAYQLLIIAGLFLTAWLVSKVIAPKVYDWMRSREGWPKWRMRLAVTLHKRLPLILFVILSWTCVLIMREMTWPSRSYLVGVSAKLSLGWLMIAVTTRLISNGFIRSLIRYVGWAWVTLAILNVSSETVDLLDSAAIEIGDIRVSIWLVVQAFLTLTALFVGAKFLSQGGSKRIKENKDISPSMKVLAVKFMQMVLYGAAFFIGLKTVGVDLTGLAVLSGAIGVGLGFGLQKVVSNLVSGIIILLDKSIKPGDVISLGDTFGWIEALGARYVSVVTRDGKEYLIPNEDLITGQVVNWSHSNDFVRLDLLFGTAYNDDPHVVRKIAIDAALSVDRVLRDRAPVCHIVNFGNSSVDYVLRFWIKDPTKGLTNIRGDVYLALWDAFKEHDISIPFPQQEVRILNDQRNVTPYED
jgi:small-conductance mechanosensitive channel